ncbi:restriction endonuclease [Noviherbaspirillum aridicola]|uniref:Membrane protein n=1 Tax=Noviherbaspirillum aridicola TaxID=2849687 RepID=A0ABQ4PZ06_9BURK|nr:restriction endonuclease [Noviherbaspirillum aridicola]GIZ50060.1 membrane protein [Noviherbaspirillum aridicola]
MKLKMAENSLFAILLRKPWWISMLLAAVVSLALAAVMPRGLGPYAASGGIPFFIIGLIAAFRQWGAPSAAAVADTGERLRAMSWNDFASGLEQAWRRQGYQVTRLDGGADFALAVGGRETVVGARRWKAASTGVEPLRALRDIAERRGAQDTAWVATGVLSDAARAFAAEHRIRIIGTAELAILMPKAQAGA